ncbi:EamA family transporter [Virgibacillus phasianinus]|uniref:EamA family transporter n=1 Tax=Virgibacillus phasianinus TaxID=2017483 RepID=A0A220U284_9BACI|nr:EamA family transporter [Virgibacillus phasianinus]ASK62200.1 EamA family transporter [Virgibacillus phasianinus]
MSLLAFVLIIISAFMHATWNYLAKRSNGGFAFVWLYTAISATVYAPFVIFLLIYQNISIGWLEIGFIAGSAIIHLGYALTLQNGYKIGDLSLIYPVARGTGPMLVAIIAVFIYDEQLSPAGIMGIILIILSVFIITGGLRVLKQSAAIMPLGYGFLIGIMIAGYTLLDKGAVSVFLISPLLLNYGSILGQLILLSPYARSHWKDVRSDWKSHRKEAIGVGVLNPLAYILVLTTMVFTPVSYVAPVREVSILIGAIMGMVLLSEGFGLRRIVAAGIMVIGIVAIALS